MKKTRNFKILFKYFKNDKTKLFLYILLVILTYLPALLSAFFWGMALEKLVLKDFNGFILFLAIWEGIYIIFYSLLQYPREALYIYLESKFYNEISKDLYEKIDCLPAIAFEDMGVGEFINRIYTDPDRIMQLLAKLIKMICKFSVVIVVFVFAFKISLILFIEMVIFAFCMGMLSFSFFPKIKKVQKQIKEDSDKYVKEITENISGIREIKSLGIKKNIENKVFRTLNSLYNKNLSIGKHSNIYFVSLNFIYFILQFIILLTCGYYYFTGKISLSLFTVMEVYIWRIDEVVEGISDFGVNFNKISVSLGRISDILDNKLYQDEKFGDISLDNPIGVIEFKNVKFKYRKEEDYTLKGLNLKIEPNKKIAIIGKSGNGKSTIFNLLLRYFDAKKGNITIDGIDIKSLSEESLRKNISIIRQAPFLFNLTIFENFKLVKEDATLEEIRTVCKKSYIDDYVMSLKNGYDTVIGEGGVNLSGGQKQRIAIARTLLLNTKIILFDEATSALDNESQEYIKKTIDELSKNHTVIIVAHRLSTIVNADVINVIDNGKLVETGSHSELIKSSKVYSGLYLNESSNS